MRYNNTGLISLPVVSKLEAPLVSQTYLARQGLEWHHYINHILVLDISSGVCYGMDFRGKRNENSRGVFLVQLDDKFTHKKDGDLIFLRSKLSPRNIVKILSELEVSNRFTAYYSKDEILPF